MFNLLTLFAAGCSGDFLGLVPWNKYLPTTAPPECRITLDLPAQLNQLWLIGIAALEDLLRIAGMVAVGFIIYAGIKFIVSRGEPDATKSALNTVIDALVGLAIAIVAAAFVSFLGNRLGGGSTGKGLPDVNPASAVSTILNIVFGIVGGISLLVIVYGGFRFVVSRGSPDETAKARNTVIYAAIGLAISLAAFSIVNFVVTRL